MKTDGSQTHADMDLQNLLGTKTEVKILLRFDRNSKFLTAQDDPAIWQVGDQFFTTDDDAGHDLAGLPLGPISVTTLGGTIAPLAAPDMVSIAANATLGSPANPLLPSANPGQAIVVNGSRLKVAQNNVSYASSLLFQTIDAAGVRAERSVQSTSASPDGTSMTIVVPANAVTGPVGIMGDPQGTSLLLQIVPVVTSIVPSTTTVRVNGKGLIEGGTLYRFGDLEVLDGSTSIAGANVDASNNDRATVSAAVGSGILTVTTAGGTSAPIAFGLRQYKPRYLGGELECLRTRRGFQQHCLSSRWRCGSTR